jgi:alpha-N-acetylglucosaminidase
MKNKIIVYIFICLTSLCANASEKEVYFTLANGIIGRMTPSVKDQFKLEIIEKENGMDVYEIESVDGKVVIRGNNGISLAKGYYAYLQEFCGCQISWCGDQLKVPTKLPIVPEKIHYVAPLKLRHIMNYCTFNYTCTWWGWERWQREIDFMAMNGLNFPLAIVGVEKVWYDTLIELGATDLEARGFISAPVHVGWQWMANLEGSGAKKPAFKAWIEKRGILGKKIQDRMRGLGMTPIQQGFSGHVPRYFKEKYPEANISVKGDWVGTFKGAAQLEPMDPLFKKVGALFFKNSDKLFGKGKYYMTDLFHESAPPVPKNERAAYLANCGRTVSKLLTDADPNYVWAMQDWSFYPDIVKAVDKDKLIIVGLGEKTNYASWGYEFTNGSLNNFGGRTHLHGDLGFLATNRVEFIKAKMPKAKLVGMGMWTEAIEINPVNNELNLNMMWEKTSIDLKKYLGAWTTRRYGAAHPKAKEAWANMYGKGNVYNSRGQGYSSMIIARPSLSAMRGGPNLDFKASLQYDTKNLTKAWSLLLEAQDQLGDAPGYQYDVVDFGRQALANLAIFYQRNATAAFLNRDRARMAKEVKRFLGLLHDVDTLVGTQDNFCLGRWFKDAKDRASSPEEEKAYLTDAAMFLTYWGSDQDTYIIYDYAWREWSGLISTFYAKRWEIFWDEMDNRLAQGRNYKDPRVTNFQVRKLRSSPLLMKMSDMEIAWINNPPKDLPSKGTGDSVMIAQKMFDKYNADLMKLPAGAPILWKDATAEQRKEYVVE